MPVRRANSARPTGSLDRLTSGYSTLRAISKPLPRAQNEHGSVEYTVTLCITSESIACPSGNARPQGDRIDAMVLGCPRRVRAAERVYQRVDRHTGKPVAGKYEFSYRDATGRQAWQTAKGSSKADAGAERAELLARTPRASESSARPSPCPRSHSSGWTGRA